MILGPVFGVDGRRGTSAKALKASKGAGARISSDYLATPPVPKFASSGNKEACVSVPVPNCPYARSENGMVFVSKFCHHMPTTDL